MIFSSPSPKGPKPVYQVGQEVMVRTTRALSTVGLAGKRCRIEAIDDETALLRFEDGSFTDLDVGHIQEVPA